MSIKKCFKCGEVKDLTLYYKHSQMADGHLNKCKECTKRDSNKHRDDNLEKVREYDRNRPNRVERVKTSGDRAKVLRRTDKDFKLKLSARCAVKSAIRNGRLIKSACCTVCKDTNTPLEGHHWSYLEENWLDVIWLCSKCHGEEHARINKQERINAGKDFLV